MSTNYGRGDGPEDEDRTTAPSGNGNPTEPIADSNPTEPVRAEGKTAPVDTDAKPRTPGGATAAAPGDAASREWDNRTLTTLGTSADTTGHWDNTTDNPTRPAEAKRRPRPGTIVWGLIVIALAVVLLLAEVATLSVDMGQVIIGLLIGAGVALVVGGVIAAGNREKDDKRAEQTGH